MTAAVPIVVLDAGRSLREAFFMFWQTLWALVLGFTLAGAVQSFVSRREMQRLLGDHGPAAVSRAALFGMASSSCSYAASAMARSLFRKGADLVSAVVFMIASTNLVVELGIVLAVLLGWQFVAAEFAGGALMILTVALLGTVMLPRALTSRIRDRNAYGDDSGHAAHKKGTPAALPWRRRLLSASGWADAAGYTVADLTMVRRELLIGYLIAGVLAVVVPTGVWQAVFLHGHGWGADVENAVVGPVIAFASFVCSIGNVPLAAALWHGGISFGGVVSFVFADLLAAPLVLIYRRYYGTALTARLVVLLWASMAASGLAVQAVFSAAGIAPTTRPARIVPLTLSWNATTVLNLVLLAALAGLVVLRRQQRRFGATRSAVDPVCGMQVERANAPATATVDGERYWFCSDGCRDRFLSSTVDSGGRPSRPST